MGGAGFVLISQLVVELWLNLALAIESSSSSSLHRVGRFTLFLFLTHFLDGSRLVRDIKIFLINVIVTEILIYNS